MTPKTPVTICGIQRCHGLMPDFLLVNLPAPNHSSVNFDPAIHEIVGDIYEEDLERDVRDYEPSHPDAL